jgi:hypothetical protein
LTYDRRNSSISFATNEHSLAFLYHEDLGFASKGVSAPPFFENLDARNLAVFFRESVQKDLARHYCQETHSRSQGEEQSINWNRLYSAHCLLLSLSLFKHVISEYNAIARTENTATRVVFKQQHPV